METCRGAASTARVLPLPPFLSGAVWRMVPTLLPHVFEKLRTQKQQKS